MFTKYSIKLERIVQNYSQDDSDFPRLNSLFS